MLSPHRTPPADLPRALRAISIAIILCACATAQETRRLRDVRASTRNVFSDEATEGNWFYALINALHVPTDPDVVVRQSWWLERGQQISSEQVHELERNLRASRLFGEVDARLEPLGDDETDLVIDSRDRFSLVFNGSFSFVGGESRFNAALGELNLFGTGRSLVADFRKTDDDERGTIRWTDPLFLDDRHRLTLAAGVTDEGPFVRADLRRPFLHRADRMSYGIDGSYQELEVDYFERGATVAFVPESRTRARTFWAFGHGNAQMRERLGLDLNVGATDYERARGRDAALIRVPGDTNSAALALFYTTDRVLEFREARGLDSIDFVEDLALGTAATLRVGAILRDEDGRTTQIQPNASLSASAALEPLTDTFVTLEGRSGVRWYAGEARGWNASAAIHAFNLSLPAQTLAASFTFDAAFESQNLPVQLTLGEDNGLRGYPAREFAGTRFARLNLEDRIRTPIELWSFHLGLAAFFDVGWVHSNRTGLSMSDAIKSTGVGLRIGSSNLLGRRVLRVDVAWPLDEVRGQSFDASLSFASGQVFSFFGNDSVLPGQFGF